jgi:hypothetical protein
VTESEFGHNCSSTSSDDDDDDDDAVTGTIVASKKYNYSVLLLQYSYE